MFASLISRLPVPLLRACAYAKAFALLEERPTPLPARYDVDAARGGAARPKHRPHQPAPMQRDDPAHGLRRHHGPLAPQRTPARRPGTVRSACASQPCLTPVVDDGRRTEHRTEDR